MLESGWLFIGFTALVITLVALMTQTNLVRSMGNADGIAIITGALGTILWGIFAYGALDIEVASNGTVLGFTMPTITFAAVAIAIVPAYIALTGPAEMLAQRYDNINPDDY